MFHRSKLLRLLIRRHQQSVVKASVKDQIVCRIICQYVNLFDVCQTIFVFDVFNGNFNWRRIWKTRLIVCCGVSNNILVIAQTAWRTLHYVTTSVCRVSIFWIKSLCCILYLFIVEFQWYLKLKSKDYMDKNKIIMAIKKMIDSLKMFCRNIIEKEKKLYFTNEF